MNGVSFLVVLFVVFAIVLAVVAFLAYRRVLRKAKGIERGLKMVPLLIHLPPPSADTDADNRDVREVMREKISQGQALYDLIAGTAQTGFKSAFYGQRHIAFEIIASGGLIHFFAAVPIAMVSVVEQAVLTAYPGAKLEEVEDHNIFNPQGRLTGTVGGELTLRQEAVYPIATFESMERDPMDGLLNSLSKLKMGDGAAVQLMLRPANPGWTRRAARLVAKKRRTRGAGLSFGPADMLRAAVKSPEQQHVENQMYQPSKLEESVLQQIENKTRHPGYEVLVRILVSSPTYDRSQMLLRNITTSFALFDAPGSNGFQFHEARDIQGLVTAFIFRFFPPEVSSSVLNSQELATLFHLPDSQFTATSQLQRQQTKQVDGPVNIPSAGMLLGYNIYRGVKKEVRLSPEDRRRHTYVVGQTGTGKSTLLENLAVQDMLNGNGFAFIDPHGDTAEKLISMVPKERAEDVVYFNPGDTEHPMGLNLFEYSTPEQKDFLIQESIAMLYKLYDPGKTGIIGPRFEHWYRNAALTLMSDPNGSSFIEIPKVFTDTAYLKNKFKYLNDPTVIEFWTKEMGQTSDYHKSEMLGWFVSKFGAFQSNEIMRNIIGQTKSAFNLRDIMDNKKILIVNLSKGAVGELNSQLLGMIFVIKFQAAAMSRAKDLAEVDRKDFCLYVDEFQNFSTDSFASILSEARKYHLNLVVANQFIGQLSEEIREAVFGNVGTIVSFRSGPEDAEFLAKQFQPIFDVRDLINLPNFNGVMRLMVGGLPSQPFSFAALPPLGQPHPEMGLAVKQLSSAKFGSTRAAVEADIFARLQNKPEPPAAAPEPAPVPTAVAAAVSNPAPAPEAKPSQPTPASEPAAAPVPVLDPLRSAPTGPKPAPDPMASTQPAQPTPSPAPTPVVTAPVQAPKPTPAPTPSPALAPAPTAAPVRKLTDIAPQTPVSNLPSATDDSELQLAAPEELKIEPSANSQPPDERALKNTLTNNILKTRHLLLQDEQKKVEPPAVEPEPVQPPEKTDKVQEEHSPEELMSDLKQSVAAAMGGTSSAESVPKPTPTPVIQPKQDGHMHLEPMHDLSKPQVNIPVEPKPASKPVPVSVPADVPVSQLTSLPPAPKDKPEPAPAPVEAKVEITNPAPVATRTEEHQQRHDMRTANSYNEAAVPKDAAPVEIKPDTPIQAPEKLSDEIDLTEPAAPEPGTVTEPPKKFEPTGDGGGLAPSVPPASPKPDLKPGEIYVDDNGNVITG